MAKQDKAGDLEQALSQLGLHLGQLLGKALLTGLENGVRGLSGHASSARAVEAGPAPVSSGKRCPIAGCPRPAEVKGLCKNHYGKAQRLKMSFPLSNKHLAELAVDGRSARTKNK